MELPVLFIKEKINGVWESNADRDIFYLEDGHFELDLNLPGDQFRIYFEKGSGSDHGSVSACRIDNLIITQNIIEIVEENNYYPFGLKHKGYNNVINGTDHKYGYNGKEEQDELGLNWIDYGARNYDPALGRWMNIDPVAEIAPSLTPFRYAFNNPLLFIDPDGMYEWRVNAKTGKYEKIGDEGGDKQQHIYFNDDKKATAVLKGSQIYVGAVTSNWHKDGDVSFAVSTVNVWEDLPDEYQGAYTIYDLKERYQAKKKGGEKYDLIRSQEEQGLARRDQIWNNRDMSDHLIRKYGNNSGLALAIETGMFEEMLPGPGWDDIHSLARNFKKTISPKYKTKADANTAKLAKASSQYSKNSWIRFLQKNKGRYKGKGYGKNWVRKAAADYHKIKDKSKI
ncbi:MAG: RHS repeat-associated core domain-containing protein [Flavobacteriaceae bacterium]|nr:RHS repeat-associated core domain-containing protein [Flavobacteriaceae bacterium]